MIFSGLLDLPWWGYVLVALGADADHHRGGHDLPAPLPGAPRARPASGREPFLPLLAVAHHRHGHQGVGGDPSQAPRQVRDRGRSAQPADPRHQQGAAGPASLLYVKESHKPETMERYGHGTPDDWIERNVYTPMQQARASSLMAAIDIALFGLDPRPADLRACRSLWIPFWAAGVINGIGHYWGYRNFQTDDDSTNIVPWGILDRRRGAAQQPPRLPDVGQVLDALVRVRPRLDVHPHPGDRSASPR